MYELDFLSPSFALAIDLFLSAVRSFLDALAYTEAVWLSANLRLIVPNAV